MSPTLKIVQGSILLVISTIDGFICSNRITTILGLILAAISAIGLFIGYKTIEEGIKEKNIEKKLDASSLNILSNMDGLIFVCKVLENEMNRLIDLNLIEMELFPSNPSTYGYYLTDLGRYILTKKLGRKIYPKHFCEMLRVRYWEAYSRAFLREKQSFKRRQHKSWDESWKVFERILINIEPNQPQKDAMGIFLSYIPGKSYDIVMRDLVVPWQKEMQKIH